MSDYTFYPRFPSSAKGIIPAFSSGFRLQRPTFLESSLMKQKLCKVKGKHFKTEEHFSLQSASDGHAVYPIFSSQDGGDGFNTVPNPPDQLHCLIVTV